MKHFNKKKIINVFLIIMAVMLVFPWSVFSAQRMSVSVDIANMRSGPGKEHSEMWQVEKYHPLIVVEKKDNWYKVKDFEGDMAWIYNSLLDNTSSVITIKNECNVRSKPGMDGQILFTVEKGIPFKVLQKEGSWIKIKHADNDIGWIYKTLVW